jgi:hypothetical protein
MFHTPAFVDDLDQAGNDLWHEEMVGVTCFNRQWVLAELRVLTGDSRLGEAAVWYVDPEAVAPPADRATVAASWGGFPAGLRDVSPPEKRWEDAQAVRRDGDPVRLADGTELRARTRTMQDEYLEWHADTVRDADGENIERVHFTCEGPEYWQHLGRRDFATLHRLYEKHLGRTIPEEDLRYPPGTVQERDRPVDVGGRYNPDNDWNTERGALHLTQVNNTLGAEVNLAARATIARRDHPDPLDAPDLLADCGAFGDPRRDSDPNIGAAANALVRDRHLVTLTDPIGLYIAAFRGDLVKLPDEPGEGVAELPRGVGGPETWFGAVRPADPVRDGLTRILRAVFAIPEGARFRKGDLVRPLRVSDLRIGTERATHGGALAELVRMHLLVDHWPADPRRRLDDVACFPEAEAATIQARARQACLGPAAPGILPTAPRHLRWDRTRA